MALNLQTSVAFLAEGSPTIGTGHVVETLNLARELVERGGTLAIWVNAETPGAILERASCQVELEQDFGIHRLRLLASEIRRRGIRGVVTNLRSVSNEQVSILKHETLRVLCIDEWGGRHLDCNAVVNTSPVTEYHQYSSNSPGFRLYAGVAYLVLSREYQAIHAAERHHYGPVRSVVVSMGGVDRTGATVRLVQAIVATRPDVVLYVVIGSGFAHRRELESALAVGQASRVEVHENLPTLAGLLPRCDVGFTAGGNTLAELACVGTPALVAFEDPHEAEQGKVFENQGFGRCLGRGVSLEYAQVREALAALDDPAVREYQCKVGKALVDGKGASRILDIIATTVHNDSPVTA